MAIPHIMRLTPGFPGTLKVYMECVMNNQIVRTAPVVVLPALPKRSSARRSRGSLGVCLCGCGRATGSRFAPGHDAKLLAWCLVAEAGGVVPDVHAAAVAVEVELRASAGISGLAHQKAIITTEIVRALVDGEVPVV